MVPFDEETNDFRLCCRRFSSTEIQAYFLRILNWPASESKMLPFSDQSLTERVLEVSPWRVRCTSAEGMNLGKGVWCLTFRHHASSI